MRRRRLILMAVAFGCATAFLSNVQAQDYEIRRKRKAPQRPPAGAPAIKPALPTLHRAGGIVGKVVDEDGAPLPGASVQIKDATQGTVTDENGFFKIENVGRGEITLVAAFVGFENQEIAVKLPLTEPIAFKLLEKNIVTREVIISASRRSEDLALTPVTAYKIDQLSVRENPSLNVYQSAGYLPGVQVINSSFLLNTINIRGFGQSMNARILYLNDGVDLQSPSIGTPLGAINGATDMDVASAEIVAGPASALYGTNAFNGVFTVVSKDAFQYPGLSAQVRGGAFHLDGRDASPQPFIDAGFRYAKSFNNKFAFKINTNFLAGNDWRGLDARDGTDYPANTRYPVPGPANPAYNGINLYGDDYPYTFDSTNTAAAGGPLVRRSTQVTRTGYAEKNLTNYKTNVFRIDLTGQYRLTKRHELVASVRYSTATGVVQPQTVRLPVENAAHVITRVELKHPRYFVRGYVLREFLPQMFNLAAAGPGVLALAKPDPMWFAQYALAYNPDNPGVHHLLNGALAQAGRDTLPAGDPQAARAFADADNRALYPYLFQLLKGSGQDSTHAAQQAAYWTQGLGRPQPGTALFDSLLHRTTRELYQNEPNGAHTGFKTGIHHIEGQYNFPNVLPNLSLIAGGSARLYTATSDNKFYYEPNGQIYTGEAGLYVQGLWRLVDSRLQITGSIRFDKNVNFHAQYSPRLAASFAVGKNRNHTFRAAFNSGFRAPTMEQQFARIQIPIGFYMGGSEKLLNLYGLNSTNTYLMTDYQRFVQARLNGTSLEDAAALLKPYNIQAIQPEIARSLETGYRANFNDKLILDGYVYTTFNLNLIGYKAVLGPSPRYLGPFGPGQIDQGNFSVFARYQNSAETVISYGAAVQAAYNFSPKFSTTVNYGYNDVHSTPENRSLITANFSNPKHIARILFTCRNIAHKIGFMSALNFASASEATFGTSIPLTQNGYVTLDLQGSYKFTSLKTILKIGGTNILNNRHTQILGGGTIGALAYVQLSFDEFLH